MFDDEIRAIVVDELAIARLGVVAMLEPLGIDVVAESHGGRDAVALASYQLPELVVLGAIADLSTVDTARRLLAIRPQPVVVALLGHAGHDDAAALARIGVHGVALRSGRIEELADVVVRAVKGEQVIIASLTASLVGAIAPSDSSSMPGADSPLTAREREVLAFLAEEIGRAPCRARV